MSALDGMKDAECAKMLGDHFEAVRRFGLSLTPYQEESFRRAIMRLTDAAKPPQPQRPSLSEQRQETVHQAAVAGRYGDRIAVERLLAAAVSLRVLEERIVPWMRSVPDSCGNQKASILLRALHLNPDQEGT